jgi:glycosyltransferase involved in cell wall biosynthesis
VAKIATRHPACKETGSSRERNQSGKRGFAIFQVHPAAEPLAESVAEPMKPKIRVAINALTMPRNLAGTGFYARQLLEHMIGSDAGFEFVLFTNHQAAESLRDLQGLEIRAIRISSIAAKALWTHAVLPSRLAGFDLLHSIGNVGLPFCPVPQVVTVLDLCQRMVPERFGLMKRLYLNAGQAWSARSAAKAIAISESTRGDLLRFHPGYASKTVTIPCASKFAIDETPSLGRDGFLFVGTLEPGKRLEFALEALALLKREGNAAQGKILSVVGARGWKHTHLPALIARLGLGEQVEFLGYLSDEELRQRYRRAECLVFPSVYEGFGLPILEAQSQGCPVIAADNSSLREVGGPGGYYFPTHDVEALAGLMRRAVAEPEAFQAIRAAAFANCARFDWTRAAEATLRVYREALASG